jgi:arginyl-tRNA synthetase
VIPGDLTVEFGRVLRAAAAAGDIPELAATMSAAGTWRAPPEAGRRRPGSYATSLPLAVAARAGSSARDGPTARAIAERLAGYVSGVPWIASATGTGPGYLTIEVTVDHLAGVAQRTAAAPDAARSDTLAGVRLTAPSLPNLASAPSWTSAWRAHRDALRGRIASTAGADVTLTDVAEEPQVADSPVAAAVAYHGTDAVRYALARTASPDPAAIERLVGHRRDLTDPFVAVRYAHADAASIARWAADLGLITLGRPSVSHVSPPGTLQPPERALLDTMSWLAERAAAAARRRRPADLAGYLEGLAAAWLTCAQHCPALPFRGRAAPADPRFRILLSAATRAALSTGLWVLGVTAPDRM